MNGRARLLPWVIATVVVAVSGCATSTRDLSETAEYQALIGKPFRLKVDCYWGEYTDLADRVMTLQPTGEHYAKGRTFSGHPADDALVGREVNGVRIRGIVRAGTVMHLTEVKVFDFFTDKRFFFMVEVYGDEAKAVYDAGRLADRSTFPPSFPASRYAEAQEAP